MSEVFDGTVDVQDGAGTTTLQLDGTQGDATVGGGGQDGAVRILDAAGGVRIALDGTSNTLSIFAATGDPLVEIRQNGDIGIFRNVGGTNHEVLLLDAAAAALRLGAEGNAGDVYVHDTADRLAVWISGATATLRVGTEGKEGDIFVRDVEGREIFHANGSNAALYLGATGNEGDLVVRDSGGRETIHLDGGGSSITVRRQTGRLLRDVLHFNGTNAALYLGTTGNEGDLVIRDTSGRDTIHLSGGEAQLYIGADGNEGGLVIRDLNGRDTFYLGGGNAALYVGANGNEGDIIVRDGSGRNVFHVDGGNAAVYIGSNGNEGDLIIRDSAGRNTFHHSADNALLEIGTTGNEGDIRVRDDAGNVRIHLDGGAGDIRLHGADCAEHFDVWDAADVDEGTVLVIDDSGALRTSTSAYDRRVAGVVSGAGGYRPGILLDSFADAPDRLPIALAGKVYCKVDASYGAIGVGDLLTTSDTAGHAMRVSEPRRAFGSVLGKALAPLSAGRGLVPILVTLQ